RRRRRHTPEIQRKRLRQGWVAFFLLTIGLKNLLRPPPSRHSRLRSGSRIVTKSKSHVHFAGRASSRMLVTSNYNEPHVPTECETRQHSPRFAGGPSCSTG